MGIGSFFKRVFGSETKRMWQSATDDDVLRLWRSQRGLGATGVNAVRDEVGRRGLYPPFLDVIDPYVTRLPGVDAVYEGETLTRWLRRHDPSVREPEPISFLPDGIVVPCGEGRHVVVLLPSVVLTGAPPREKVLGVEELLLIGARSDFPPDDVLAARFELKEPDSIHVGAADFRLESGSVLVHVATTGEGTEVAGLVAVVDDMDEELRYLVGAKIPVENLFEPLPPVNGAPVPAFVVGGLVIVKDSGDDDSDEDAPPDADQRLQRATAPSVARGLTASQAAAALNRRLSQANRVMGRVIDRAAVDRIVLLTDAVGVDAPVTLVIARELGVPTGAVGSPFALGEAARAALAMIGAPPDGHVGEPAPVDADVVSAAVRGLSDADLVSLVSALVGAGDPRAGLIARSRQLAVATGEAVPASHQLIIGLVAEAEHRRHLVHGDVAQAAESRDVARAAYEAAADDEPRADAQLIVLDAGAGQTDLGLRAAPLVDEEPDLMVVLNRALLEWRFGRAPAARALLTENDASAVSFLGRVIEDTLTEGRPAESPIPLLSPLLLDGGQVELARAFLVAGDAATGERLLDRALELEPGNAVAGAMLAVHSVRTGNAGAALVVIDALLTRYRHAFDLRWLRAEILCALGQHQGALADVDLAFDHASGRVEARLARISLLIRLGQKDRARTEAAALTGDGGDATLVRAVTARVDEP